MQVILEKGRKSKRAESWEPEEEANSNSILKSTSPQKAESQVKSMCMGNAQRGLLNAHFPHKRDCIWNYGREHHHGQAFCNMNRRE